MTPKGYERKVAAQYRKHGFTVARADENNYMPDFVVFNNRMLFFVECKRYLSCTKVEHAMRRILRNQHKQSQRLMQLSMTTPVLYRFMLKGGVEANVTVHKGDIKYGEPYKLS